ncbi:LysR substrate-binding domain-containing protein [Georgenia sp. SYP-B2076]|uniref:LysR substrate-binding domain-containing protein n=1 Tax=Georgenia sp. SYP-B2076 TaxID=2495881 RepID=UPI000F8C8F18|nr:LysR substrate-binding domain-containing protein [Georgenia sp. SYP-B2076]
MTEPFRVRFAPGVTPDKWLKIWASRMPASPLEAAQVEEAGQTAVLRAGEADMCFVRLPVDREGLHVIPLYGEVPVVVVAKDHPVAAFDEVAVADLADEHLLQDPDDVPEWRAVARELRDGTRVDVPTMTVKQAVEVAAAGAGIVIVPMSLARLHHRKDVVHRPVTGVAERQVALAWRADDEDPRVETFIGIVRGRTEQSSRGGAAAPAPKKAAGGRRATPTVAPRPRRGTPRRRSR